MWVGVCLLLCPPYLVTVALFDHYDPPGSPVRVEAEGRSLSLVRHQVPALDFDRVP